MLRELSRPDSASQSLRKGNTELHKLGKRKIQTLQEVLPPRKALAEILPLVVFAVGQPAALLRKLRPAMDTALSMSPLPRELF